MLYGANATNFLNNLKELTSSANNFFDKNRNYQSLSSEDPAENSKKSVTKAASELEALKKAAMEQQQKFADSHERLDAQDTKCAERKVSIHLQFNKLKSK